MLQRFGRVDRFGAGGIIKVEGAKRDDGESWSAWFRTHGPALLLFARQTLPDSTLPRTRYRRRLSDSGVIAPRQTT